MYEGLSAAMSSAAAFLRHLIAFFEEYWNQLGVNTLVRQMLDDQALCWNFSDLLQRKPRAEHLLGIARLGEQLSPRMARFKWPDAVPWSHVCLFFTVPRLLFRMWKDDGRDLGGLRGSTRICAGGCGSALSWRGACP